MPALVPGQLVKRLILSTTGRDIQPGDIGVIDAINGEFDYFPVQWQRTGLWSMMHPSDLYERYEFIQ